MLISFPTSLDAGKDTEARGMTFFHFTGRKTEAREGVSGRPAPVTNLANGRAPSSMLFPGH